MDLDLEWKVSDTSALDFVRLDKFARESYKSIFQTEGIS